MLVGQTTICKEHNTFPQQLLHTEANKIVQKQPCWSHSGPVGDVLSHSGAGITYYRSENGDYGMQTDVLSTLLVKH